MQGGALVNAVVEGGWASLAGLLVEDLVLAVDGRPVGGVAVLRELLEEATARRPRSVVLQVRRGIHLLFVEMLPAWDAGNDKS